jgi:hypothetical protein
MTQRTSQASWNGDMSSFDWKVAYQTALFETNPAKIQERIVDAQIAILKREHKLLASPWCREQQELDDALRFLGLLHNEALNAALGEREAA